VRRVGGTKDFPWTCDHCRNRDLRAKVSAGRFGGGQDLYFRLAAAWFRFPPLRDRLEDIRYWLLACSKIGAPGVEVPVMLSSSWIAPLALELRELKIRWRSRSAFLDGSTLEIRHLNCASSPSRERLSHYRSRDQARKHRTRTIEQTSIKRAENKARAAQLLGIALPHVTKAKKYQRGSEL